MYDRHGTKEKADLVEAYAPLVKRVAFHLIARLPASVELDDIVQNGMIGLLNAIDRYESGMGAQFETYAVQRIRGAMLDGLRGDDSMPRALRRELRRIEGAIHAREQQLGRAPTEGEIAESLGMPLDEYQQLLQDARGHQLVYLEDFVEMTGESYFERNLGDESADPARILDEANLREFLVHAVEALPEREKIVMGLYYDEELNLREIGEVLGVTESRVCQLHSQAVARLRAQVLGEAAPVVRKRGRPRKSPAIPTNG